MAFFIVDIEDMFHLPIITIKCILIYSMHYTILNQAFFFKCIIHYTIVLIELS